MTLISYGQNCEDILLWRAFSHIDGGFYIDVGANHPVNDSATKLLYDNGWSGINIEPLEEWHKLLVDNRTRDINLRVCVGSRPGPRPLFKVVRAEGLSTLDPEIARVHRDIHGFEIQKIEVEVRTLNDILLQNHAPEKIHLLKIDTAGTEGDVLESIDLRAHRPWILMVESTYPGTTRSTHQDWEPSLLGHEYTFVFFDGLNRFYIADEHRDSLARHFAVPPNCFDRFERYRERALRHRVCALERRLKESNAKSALGRE